MPLSKMSFIFRSAVVFLALVIACLSLSTTVSAQTLTELREKQETLEAQKTENDEKLRELENDIEEKTAHCEVLLVQMEDLQLEIEELQLKATALDIEISDREDDIAVKQSGIDENTELLKKRIRALYVSGDATAIELVLSSEDLLDFSEKVQVIKAVTEHDRVLIDELVDEMTLVREELSLLKLQKEELSDTKADLEEKSILLSDLYSQAVQLLTDAENAEFEARENGELISVQLKENESAIKKLEAQISRENSISLAGTGFEGTGSFAWPIPGYSYLSCYFGSGGHRGIDVAGGNINGKPIVATDSGVVTFAGWHNSYGYCVFISHGNGYETRYAHMSALATGTGALVERGQVIGNVGSTGNSTGPHLHFEVIYNGSLVNPMNYF